jgi:hypothetical protein
MENRDFLRELLDRRTNFDLSQEISGYQDRFSRWALISMVGANIPRRGPRGTLLMEEAIQREQLRRGEIRILSHRE